jgi:hypothetical protein
MDNALSIAAAKLSGEWTAPVPEGQRPPPTVHNDPQRLEEVCAILAEIGALEAVLMNTDLPFSVIREVLARHRCGEFD